MLRLLELSWLLLSLGGFSFGTYKTFSESFSESVYIYMVSAIALAFYLMRRKQRINMKQKEN